MHIGFVSQFVYPHDWETRITKCTSSFLRAGHRVTVYCKGGATSPAVETQGPVTIRHLRANTLPLNPRWYSWLWRAFGTDQIDVVIVRNLRLAAATICAARRAGIPVVMDLGENQPALADALGKRHLGHFIIRNRWLVAALERWCVRRADEVWVVAEANRRRLAGVIRDGAKLRLIRNVPDLAAAPSGVRGASGARLRLVYLGILDELRGLDMLLAALARTQNVDCVLVGDGPERGTLESLVRTLGLAERVMFRGWVSGAARLDELLIADVGVIPHRVNHLTQTTEPNKLFDYMLCALPVLSTPLDPVRDVLLEVQCGVVADFAPTAFADAIVALAADPVGRRAMGERGRRAVLERYNWERESREVLAGVSNLI